MKRVAFHTLGCKVNSYETDAMKELMRAAGYKIVEFTELADIYIINTCSVTNIADRKSRQMLHKAKAENPDAVIVAAGCYVQSAADKLKEDNKIDIIIGNNKKKDIVNIISKYYKEGKESTDNKYIIDINNTNEYEELCIEELANHTRAFIKIQDGCNQFCSYCIIPYTRGRVRSRTSEDIVKEVTNLTKKGYREVVLTGIHISSYGSDLEEDINLLKLIQKLGQIEKLDRIRAGSLEPRIITKDFIAGLKTVDKFCPHFHLSLQSGCDKILKNMNRHYTTADFREGVRLIRQAYKSPAITTDIIVGFPGETKEDFILSKNFAKEIGFFEMHIFPYSKREGTKAAQMKEQLTSREKSGRGRELSEIGELSSDLFRNERIGRFDEILLEDEFEYNDKKYIVGHTKEYVKIAIEIPEGEKYENKLAYGKVTGKLKKDILLMLADKIY